MEITIKSNHFGQPIPLEVEVSFSLPYRDWCKLAETDAWRFVESFGEEPDTEQDSLRRVKGGENHAEDAGAGGAGRQRKGAHAGHKSVQL